MLALVKITPGLTLRRGSQALHNTIEFVWLGRIWWMGLPKYFFMYSMLSPFGHLWNSLKNLPCFQDCQSFLPGVEIRGPREPQVVPLISRKSKSVSLICVTSLNFLARCRSSDTFCLFLFAAGDEKVSLLNWSLVFREAISDFSDNAF